MPATTAPFALDPPFHDPFRKRLVQLFGKPLEHALGLEELNQKYASLGDAAPEDFLARALAVLNVQTAVAPEDLVRIPTTGAFLAVSNHPFGGLDGMILLELVRRVRPDTKVMANFLLARVPQFHDSMIFVDPFRSRDAARHNLAALKLSIKHLEAGHPLIIFPAGEVSHLDLPARAILDPRWSDTVARIIRRTGVPVLPVYFHGNNSKLFNVLGLIHPLLRTCMLPRELLNKQHSRVTVEIGSAIPFKKLDTFATDEEMTAYLRLRTYILQTRRADTVDSAENSREQKALPGVHSPIIAPVPADLLAAELRTLPAESLLLENTEFAIYASKAEPMPHLLREIGRLREITFRGASEGTGKPLDIDEFDQDYVHLFCWHKTKQEVVGAYRMGPTDVILHAKGVRGLYTRTLFRFHGELVEQMGPALELGRSFVRPEYQRSYSPLLLLWKGIAHYVVKHPRYQVLFGPVSINNRYQSFSRQLIMTFLRHTSRSHLAGLIRAKNPPRIRPIRGDYIRKYSTVVRDIDEISDLVQEIESDHKGIPILLKQYMKLSARILGFNVDPDFGDVLDGLMVVDLRQTPQNLIERFAGKDGAAMIRAYRPATPGRAEPTA
jgi:putative hemolysin